MCKFHLANSVYRMLYEKCEKEAISSADKLIKECSEVIDEVEYLKIFERNWKSFQQHYVRYKLKGVSISIFIILLESTRKFVLVLGQSLYKSTKFQ